MYTSIVFSVQPYGWQRCFWGDLLVPIIALGCASSFQVLSFGHCGGNTKHVLEISIRYKQLLP